MYRSIFFSASIALATIFTASAGTLENGKWSASGCGAMPGAPVVESSSIDAFNKSIGKINDWQKQIQTYHDCMVKEANADSAAINKAATSEQTRINESVEKMNKEAAAGKEKVEASSSSSSSSSPSLVSPPGAVPGSQMY